MGLFICLHKKEPESGCAGVRVQLNACKLVSSAHTQESKQPGSACAVTSGARNQPALKLLQDQGGSKGSHNPPLNTLSK